MKYDQLTQKKHLLDQYRPLPKALVQNLDDWFRIELTYTSNAIEGNTLTRRETALVVEKGLAVGGKSLKEHLEATNHAHALDWVNELVKRLPAQINEKDVLYIHELILKGIDDASAGHYRNVPVRIAGSTVILPNPRKVLDLMTDFTFWLQQTSELHPIEFAAEAHYQLVTIHPFVDGNGRTARLLMNMILLMHGYPFAIIRKRDRLAYLAALEQAQLGGSKEAYLQLIAKSVDRSLDIYLKAARGGEEKLTAKGKLFKIGAFASAVGEPTSTIRHWTKEGLLDVAEVTASGYQLYAPEMVERVKKIHALKKERYTLAEIKQKLSLS